DGAGTAYSGLALALARAGHDVTVLYLPGDRVPDHTIEYWVSRHEEMGMQLVPLPRPGFRTATTCAHDVTLSYYAYLWLKEHEFDLIHFMARRGAGYWSVVAKHQGLAFGRTTLCTGVHGPTLLLRMSRRGHLSSVDDLDNDFMERGSVALADVVVSASHFLIGWMQEHGWQLPARCHVQPTVIPRATAASSDVADEPGQPPRRADEIVFLGRLLENAGLPLFCDALDRLAAGHHTDCTVTFLGRPGTIDGEDSVRFVRRRASRWPFRWQVIGDKDRQEALEYLAGGNRVAVVPSLAAIWPTGVLHCLDNGIPLIAGHVGAAPEMVAPEDRERVLVPLRPDILADRLRTALREGIRPGRPMIDFERNEQEWLAWHASLPRADQKHERVPPTAAPEPLPLVSICMPTYNRPRLLRQALESIDTIDYPNLEVVLVDDGSTDPAAVELLEELSATFPARGWQLIRQENKYASAARNTAARHARGEHLFFMDDDNYAKPHGLSVFVEIARRTGADIVASFRENFKGLNAPGRDDQAERYHTLFLGRAAVPGLFRNVFGDMNALVRRDVYLAVGGQSEDYGLGFQDWEFFAKAVLAGYTLEVIPESLFFYRVTEGGICNSTPRVKNLARIGRRYQEAMPEALRDLVSLAQGMILHEWPREYRKLPGLHLIRVGLGNCLREGPRSVIAHVL
ncbi:MAG: glycosyltransferase, partial [Planctomycetota bacterium]